MRPTLPHGPRVTFAVLILSLTVALAIAAPLAGATRTGLGVTKVLFERTAVCPSPRSGWEHCGRLAGTVTRRSQAQWLYAELTRMVALNRAAVAHGPEPVIFCQAGATDLRFHLDFLGVGGSAGRAVIYYISAGPCTQATFTGDSRTVRFDLWSVGRRFQAYLVALSRDIGVTPQQLCPKWEGVAENLCGF